MQNCNAGCRCPIVFNVFSVRPAERQKDTHEIQKYGEDLAETEEIVEELVRMVNGQSKQKEQMEIRINGKLLR